MKASMLAAFGRAAMVGCGIATCLSASVPHASAATDSALNQITAAGATALAGPAAADDIVVTNGPSTIRIKHIEVAGSSLSSAEIAALFATKDAKDLEARLRKLDAASIVIPEITADWVNGTTHTHLTQTQVMLADVRGGRATTGSAAAGTVTFKDDDADTKLTIGATSLKGIDLAQIVHLQTGPRIDDDEPLRPVCDEIAAHAITVAGAALADQPVTIATLRETGLKARPLKAVASEKADAAALSDAAQSFALEAIEADDIGLAGPMGAATEGLRHLALKHVAVHGLGQGRLARFELNGLAVEGNDKQPGTLSLASAQVDNVATNATRVPSIDKIDLGDLAIDIPAGDKSNPDARIAFSIAHAGYEAPGLVIGRLPAKATLSIAHAKFDVPPDNGAAPVLLAMGYKHLDLSSESVSRYDAAGQTLDIDRLSLAGVGMGAIDVKLGLAKVTEGIVSQNDAVQKAAAAAILVKTVDVTLRNDGLIDKAIGFKAAIDGVSAEQERTNILQLVDTGLVGLGLQSSEKAQRVVAALHKFIADPRTLHVAVTSKTGLGADSMALIDSPQALLDAVEVEASADE